MINVFRILLPSRKHGDEVVPAVQHNHDQMSEKKKQNCPHHREVPDAGVMKAAHRPGQPGELHRFPDRKPSENGKYAEHQYRSVCELLKWVVNLARLRLRTEKEIVVDHGPNAANVARRE